MGKEKTKLPLFTNDTGRCYVENAKESATENLPEVLNYYSNVKKYKAQNSTDFFIYQ